MRKLLSIPVSIFLVLNPVWPVSAQAQSPAPGTQTTPIQHVIVIFDENISFDHYFGTYPKASNLPGQPRFVAIQNTPSVNGYNPGLLTNNPNLNTANGAGAANPFRLNRSQALTADQNHNYGPEQASFDHGLMDLFPLNTGTAGTSGNMSVLTPAVVTTKGLVMGYYDGNTVTALWEYAQNFAMSDNFYDTQFGPSSPGAVNLISGQTNGINQSTVLNANSSDEVADGQGGFTLNGDSDPLNDTCAGSTKMQFNFTPANTNIGNLLNGAGLTWGWFQGGFNLQIVNPNGSTGCNRSTVSPITGLTETDYVPHHEPFQFYPGTANPTHARPTTSPTVSIGGPDATANHQYDMNDFFTALNAGNLANVSYLKPPAYQNGHPGNSNPLDEQAFIVSVVNAVMASSFWNSTAIIITYDDSDGWYDHQMGPIVNASFSSEDSLSGASACGLSGTTPQLPGPNTSNPVNGRCGYGVRLPLLAISPWAKANYVDSTVTDQTSVLRFIEDNWSLGRLGGGSFDAIANPITGMFNFSGSTGTPPAGTPTNTNTPILSTITGLP